MVLIHIRDVSDPVKRLQMFNELIKIHGRKNLIVDVQANDRLHIELFGEYVSAPTYISDLGIEVGGKSLSVYEPKVSDEVLFKVHKRIAHQTRSYGGDYQQTEETEKDRTWTVIVRIKDIRTIQAQEPEPETTTTAEVVQEITA